MTSEERDAPFEQALIWMKCGCRVRRAGWNGKGMWISICTRTFALDDTDDDALYLGTTVNSFVASQKEAVLTLPFLVMKTADNKILMGWLASQTDLLAEDWEMVR